MPHQLLHHCFQHPHLGTVVSLQQHCLVVVMRVGQSLPGDVRGRAVHGFEDRQALRVDVAAADVADAAHEAGGKVRQDVPEEVVRDDHLEAPRLGDQQQGSGVDVTVGGRHLGVVGGDLVEDSLPQAAGPLQDVDLVDHGQAPALPGGELEGVLGDYPRCRAVLGGQA